MDIYSPDPNDEIFIELRQWCLVTPLDLSQLESDYVKELHPMFGQKHTDETRQLMSKSHSGENNHMYGKRGVNNPNYGRTREDLIIINKSRAGRTVSDDTKDKLREQRIGENNPMYGKSHSEESKKKMAKHGADNPAYGKKFPQEKITCPNCGTIGGKGLMKRYHFDNCTR